MSNRNASKLTLMQDRNFYYLKKNPKKNIMSGSTWVLVIKSKRALLVLIPDIFNELVNTLDERKTQLTSWHNRNQQEPGSKTMKVYYSAMKAVVWDRIFLKADRKKTSILHKYLAWPVITWVGRGGERGEWITIIHLIWFYPRWEILC